MSPRLRCSHFGGLVMYFALIQEVQLVAVKVTLQWLLSLKSEADNLFRRNLFLFQNNRR